MADRRDGTLQFGALLSLLLLLAACGGGSAAIQIPDGPPTVNQAAADAALERFNTYRNLSAVQQVRLDYDLSLGCQAHAQYLAVNDIDLRNAQLDAHHEDARLPGYSLAGEYAGVNSVIYQGVTPVASIDNWMRTFYHRLGLLNPNLYYVGFGSVGDYQVMDVVRGRVQGPVAASRTVLYPPPGMTNVPVDYKTEIPHPVPGDDELGIPVTIEFFGGIGSSIELAQASLVDLAQGTELSCYVQVPGHPLLPGWDYQQVIALIPRDPLPSGRTIRAVVAGYIDGEPWAAEWDFTTQ